MKRVYICSSSEDRLWKEKLKIQLKVLERNGLIEVWDEDIEVGTEIDVRDRLGSADMVVLMVTSNFLISDTIQDEQIPLILERQRVEGMRIFPIIVKPCNWKETPWLRNIQVAPKNGTPLAKANEFEVEETMASIAGQIGKLSKTTANNLKSIPVIPKSVKKEVFISYAWGGESELIADRLEAAFGGKGISLVRDKKDLGFKGSIKGFMERIGKGFCVVALISDKYLRSENCMFELIQISKAGDFANRIFPIVLPDAVGLYKAVNRLEYIAYWELQITQLEKAIRSLNSSANLQEAHEELNLYTEIRSLLERLVAVLKDMNTLSLDIHNDTDFEAILNAVSEKVNS